MEPSARVVYLAFAPYALSDLELFRWRWSLEAGDSSLKAFAKRWGVIDDARSFGVRTYLVRHRQQVDPIRPALQDANRSKEPMQERDLKQTITGLLELAHSRGYTADDLAQIKKAHWSALVLSSGGYRPCGRPFINHLIGTASVLVHFGFETRVVVGGLLHAAYTHAPRMRGGAQETVDTVARWLGGADTPTERTVRGYTVRSSRWTELSKLDNWRDVATTDDIDTAVIAMANLVDMRLSGEIRVTGRADDRRYRRARESGRDLRRRRRSGSRRVAAQDEKGARLEIFADDKRPKGSFRLEGPKMVPMVNRAFFEVQRSVAAKARARCRKCRLSGARRSVKGCWMSDRARFAIVTPYYQEEKWLLERCIRSVREQTLRADHIMVADGFPQDWIDGEGVRHIRLDRAHADYGNTPRTIGALLAVSAGYEGIGFLDADNWYELEHVARCAEAAGRSEACDYVIAQRHLRRPDGSIIKFDEPPPSRFADMSCFFLLPGSYHVIPHLALTPQQIAPVCDRVFYAALKAEKPEQRDRAGEDRQLSLHLALRLQADRRGAASGGQRRRRLQADEGLAGHAH